MNLQQDHYRCPTQSRAALLSHAALRGSEWWAHPCHLHLADCSDTGRWAAWSYPFVALTIRVGDEHAQPSTNAAGVLYITAMGDYSGGFLADVPGYSPPEGVTSPHPGQP